MANQEPPRGGSPPFISASAISAEQADQQRADADEQLATALRLTHLSPPLAAAAAAVPLAAYEPAHTAAKDAALRQHGVDPSKLEASRGLGGYTKKELQCFCTQLGLFKSAAKPVLCTRIQHHVWWTLTKKQQQQQQHEPHTSGVRVQAGSPDAMLTQIGALGQYDHYLDAMPKDLSAPEATGWRKLLSLCEVWPSGCWRLCQDVSVQGMDAHKWVALLRARGFLHEHAVTGGWLGVLLQHDELDNLEPSPLEDGMLRVRSHTGLAAAVAYMHEKLGGLIVRHHPTRCELFHAGPEHGRCIRPSHLAFGAPATNATDTANRQRVEHWLDARHRSYSLAQWVQLKATARMHHLHLVDAVFRCVASPHHAAIFCLPGEHDGAEFIRALFPLPPSPDMQHAPPAAPTAAVAAAAAPRGWGHDVDRCWFCAGYESFPYRDKNHLAYDSRYR